MGGGGRRASGKDVGIWPMAQMGLNIIADIILRGMLQVIHTAVWLLLLCGNPYDLDIAHCCHPLRPVIKASFLLAPIMVAL